MKVKNIDVSVEIQKVQEYLATQKELSSETVALFKMLISIITLLLNLFGANSKNSGKPPSQDPFRAKKQRGKTDKKPGAQKGHIENSHVQYGASLKGMAVYLSNFHSNYAPIKNYLT